MATKAASKKSAEEALPTPQKPVLTSEFAQYLDQHPEMSTELIRVLTKMYQDPPKECDVLQ